jgi:DNA-binding FadR family transcriptional regulator
MQMLKSGRYRVGEKIPSEWKLVRQLSVGRSALREAIRELAGLGVLETHRGSGTYVASLRPDLLVLDTVEQSSDRTVRLQLLEVRLMVEPHAAALAAQRATEGDKERLHQNIERLRDGVATGFRPPEDLGFHLDILRATHNPSLLRMTAPIVAYYQRDMNLPTERDVRQHNAILDAIRVGDGPLAEQEMRLHLLEEIHLVEMEKPLRSALAQGKSEQEVPIGTLPGRKWQERK